MTPLELAADLRAYARQLDTERYERRLYADALKVQSERLDALILAVDRVLHKYGCDNNGEPLDWTEWKDVRIALSEVRKGTP